MKKYTHLLLTFMLLFSFGFASNKDAENQSLVRNEMKFYSDHIIDTTEVINDRIRIIGGDLFVYGETNNTIMVLGGDVTIGATAIINSEIVVMGGTVQIHEGAVVTGKIKEANLNEGLVYREIFTDSAQTKKHTIFELKNKSEWLRKGWIHPNYNFFVYNRNEGARLTFFNHDYDHGDRSPFRLSISTAYRTAPNDFSGRISFEKSFFKNRFFILYASAFKEAVSDDEYRLKEAENTLTSFFARQDFYDRWDEQGWELGFALDLNRLKVKVFTSDAQQDSIPVDYSMWSLSEKNRTLRSNPHVQYQSTVGSYKGTLAFQSEKYHPLKTGYSLLLQGEAYQKTDDGDNVYWLNKNGINTSDLRKRLLIMTRLHWEFSPGLVLRNQMLLGLSNGRLHPFRKFGIGGIGSVSAYPYKTQIGDHMIQSNVEFIMTPNFTDGDLFFKLFYDTGIAFDSDAFFIQSDDLNKRSSSFISSVGFGIGTESDDGIGIGFNVAKPLDGSDYLETTVRFNFNF
ncbi:MAG: hypothetical protein HN657_06115 [Candidatus Marinimicrobia bacterium]|jgi:hypothetical protein|nr:hypothetical protein [Candidatus Neomarinimicrobiota bacterium]MBT3496165.1 hypothetical protein [Candidatus Neomarinimicrobiota bacterium]MBT3692803.1 hypothetical protein [Candidatus Neomarinimicrobiota bacterium]MBT3731836.1 hypothetical protein [Candidatus Neomarinimicrobiota bacterium]MBT4145075.1 hypothetical protein [Candidatus Neomarinimicrobiota bacterium]